MSVKNHISISVILIFSTFLTACQSKNDNSSPSPFQPVVSNPGGGSAPSEPGATPSPILQAPGKIKINSGSATTSSSQVTLQLERETAIQMKISENRNCSGGTWEAFAGQKSWTLGTRNQNVEISVEFLIGGGQRTACSKADIVHDDILPNIRLSLDPNNSYTTGSSTHLLFQVQDLGSGLKSVECTHAGSVVPCFVDASGVGELTLPNNLVGLFVFQIKALDQASNLSSSQITWSVRQGIRPVDQTLTIKAQNKVDLLFVVDNSESMTEEQQSMARRMSSLTQKLEGLDWQMGVTTTDARDIPLGDGRLIELTGKPNQFVLDSKTPSDEAQKIIGATLQRPEIGSSSEQGINATYRAVERSLRPESPNASLFRADAAFVTVLISDEDETGTGPKNQAKNLLSLIQNNWQSQKNFVFHSIIVKPGDTACLAKQQTVYGKKYAELSRLTGQGSVGGSILGSVCESDYAAQLSGIGKSIQQLQQTMTLDCEPLNNQIQIDYNGQPYSEKFEKNALKLIFEKNLEPGAYRLRYVCAS